jgi:FixJ family two-component response regulator
LPEAQDLDRAKRRINAAAAAAEAEAPAEPDPTTGRNVLQRATGRNGDIAGAFVRGSVMRKIAEAIALETEPLFGLIKAVLILAGEIDRDREKGRNRG